MLVTQRAELMSVDCLCVLVNSGETAFDTVILILQRGFEFRSLEANLPTIMWIKWG